MNTSDMQKPENYIIIDNKDGTFSAFVNYGIYNSEQEAENSLEIVMNLMGLQLQKHYTLH